MALDGNANVQVLNYYIGELREHYAGRQSIRIGQRLQTGDIEPDAAIKELSALVAISSSNGEFTVRSAAEILELELDENDCLFGDRLLTKGGKLVIAGAAGIGKTRLLLQLATASITGRDLCGLETHAKGLRWLILQTENSNRRLQFELKVLTREFGKDFLNSLFIHTIETDADGFVALDNDSAVRRLEAAIHKYQPGIVGVDPLRDFRIGNLDTDADMTTTCEALGHIVRAGNPQRGLVALHHALTGKAGASKATGYERSGFARNSKALLSWARAQINIAPGNPDDNDQLVIACGKNNDGKEFPPFAVRLNLDTMMYEPDESFDVDRWRDEITGSKTKRYRAESSWRRWARKPSAKRNSPNRLSMRRVAANRALTS
jgi:hypothetical protein